MSLDGRINRYCDVDPMDYFGLPPKDPPAALPTLALSLFPPLAEFIDFGGASRHIMTNTGTSRLVLKVKCSNNTLFKVSPVYAFLDPGASTELQILRQEGPTRNDKLVVMYKETTRGQRDPRKAYEVQGQTEKKVLPLITRESEESL